MVRSPVVGSVWTSPSGEPVGSASCALMELFAGDLEEMFSALLDVELGEPPGDELSQRARDLLASPGLPPDPKLAAQWILSLTSGAVSTELAACLKTSGPNPAPVSAHPLSPQHLSIAHTLGVGDVLVTFNYDVVMQVALLYARKLDRSSFANPSIDEIWFPPRFSSSEPVGLATPHGSFSWFGNITTSRIAVVIGRDQAEALSHLPSGYGAQGHGAGLILPIKSKSRLLTRYPMVEAELIRLLDATEECMEVHLIGKQFQSADTDVAARIKERCEVTSRRVVYVNPSVADAEWVDHHNEIFNADEVTSLEDLDAYVDFLSSSNGRPRARRDGAGELGDDGIMTTT